MTTNTYIDIQGEIQDMVKKRFMTQIFYPLKCISVKRTSAVLIEANLTRDEIFSLSQNIKMQNNKADG